MPISGPEALLRNIDNPKPYKFIGFGDIHGPKPYKFIGFGDIHGPKPNKFIGFGDIHGPKPYGQTTGSHGRRPEVVNSVAPVILKFPATRGRAGTGPKPSTFIGKRPSGADPGHSGIARPTFRARRFSKKHDRHFCREGRLDS